MNSEIEVLKTIFSLLPTEAVTLTALKTGAFSILTIIMEFQDIIALKL